MALYGTVPPFQDPEIPIEDTEVSKVIGLGLNHLVMALNATMWGPPVMERWFINPMNTIVIGTINHIVIGVINQLSYLGGPTLHDLIGEHNPNNLLTIELYLP